MIIGEDEKLKEKLIRSVFVISSEGTPILLRNYEEDSTVKDKEVLFAGFFSAIQMFSQNALEKDIRDIQMGSSKYYFMSGNDYLVILEVYYSDTEWEKRKEIEQAINKLIDNIQSTMTLFKELGDNSSKEDLGNVIDSLVFETELECSALLFEKPIKNDELAENYTEIFEKGKEVDEELEESFWKKFKKLFKK